MLVLVLMVQVLATIVSATVAVELVPRSLDLDDIRPEDDDNAVVIEGQYQSSILSRVPRL